MARAVQTTLAVLLATLDVSITIIAMPDIFRGVQLKPLKASKSVYLLWMILGYMTVGSFLIVCLGRPGGMFERAQMYHLGFPSSTPRGRCRPVIG